MNVFAPALILVTAACLAFAERSIAAEPLPGTTVLEIEQPLDEVMVDGIDRFALRAIAESKAQRDAMWKRDYSNREAYEKSVAANRDRLRTIIGAVDPRIEAPQIVPTSRPIGSRRGGGDGEGRTGVRVRPVTWNVLEGVTAEGLWLEPADEPVARVIALPDADWTPEMFAGVAEGIEPQVQLARRLAERGCQVLVPTIISRDSTYSGHPDIGYTNQPHREFIYRMAFQMGRHVIGYEVQKVLAGVDALEQLNATESSDLPIAVAGIGEGGLLALYSAALDPRIDAAYVGGYFQQRDDVWQEPIYRNVWSLLTEFGDAELASLVAPRTLIIEACTAPTVDGPPAPESGRRGGAAPGRIATPTIESVKTEFDRALPHYEKLGSLEKFVLTTSENGSGPAGSDAAINAIASAVGASHIEGSAGRPSRSDANRVDAGQRQKRQFDELVEFTQALYRRSARVRDEFWSKADRSSVDAWVKSSQFYRDYIWEEMIGKLPEPTTPPNVRTRKILDEPEYAGYEVVIDVYPDVIAAGILLLPKDLSEGEKRPVVVCQHGLEGVPMNVIEREGQAYAYYKAFAAELAKRGFITYAPQNPYRGMDRFRTLQRKSNPMKRSLFSYIIRQHERTLEWLSSLPNVDPQRIGFYGLSYGGKTAVRVPPILTQYALSICSADFNEWIRKNVSNTDGFSYIFTPEYEMFEWNMGHVANYAELSTLMTPRPFMVERGHGDGVAPDEWVAWEYAKVRRHYDLIGLGDKTEIEFFNGPHSINGQGTFEFLHRQLNWPKRESE